MTVTVAVLASQLEIDKSADFYGQPVAQRALRFADAPDGGILVYDGASAEVALTLPQGTNGFLRGALRGLADRRRRGELVRADAGEELRGVARQDRHGDAVACV
ncbi:MAG: hypothetical protein IT357_17190 [Gemmatimonadaceae bacterium]|nr:hypothetical protein [Gemmatimonadaceae bacterium]